MLDISRTKKAKLNMFFSLFQQGIALICGIIIPRLMISTFGSEAYGATSSIATFLSYITLLEGGIGAVTRAALYKAFASKSLDRISAVINETKKLYQKIAIAFVIYVLIIALLFKTISGNTAFSYWYSFGLVLVIAISTFADYFIGISNSLLLQADQANYIPSIFRILTTVLNTIVIIILINWNCNIITVKLVSSIVFALRPLLLSIYVKRNYHLNNHVEEEQLLQQKGSALGQHIAWAIHNNTDITILTIFKDLSWVSVYSVYYLVTSQLQSIINSFSSGMEAVFGSMYANNESINLQKTFGYYETLISIISTTLFSTAAVLIIPFVDLYTKGITDIEYIQPLFAFLLIVASLLYCYRTPYGHMIIAAGHFKETRIAAYGEAVINLFSSILLVIKFGIVGVAIGTVLATAFRFIYYVIYLSKNILFRSCSLWIKRILTNSIAFAVVYFLGTFASERMKMDSYLNWAIAGVLVICVSLAVVMIVNIIFYFEDVKAIVSKGLGKIIRR